MTVLWVLWHRIRGHFVEPNGWLSYHGHSSRIWRCVLPCREERTGYAPGWLRWKEKG